LSSSLSKHSEPRIRGMAAAEAVGWQSAVPIVRMQANMDRPETELRVLLAPVKAHAKANPA